MPKKLERCVKKVKKQGKEESDAYAICSASTGIKRKKGGGWKKVKENNMKDQEFKATSDFIHKICGKDYSVAKEKLQDVIDLKIKNRIHGLTKDNS